MSAVSSTDQTVTISDSTGAISHPATITVPAGSLTKHFSASGIFAPSDDTLTASNANGSASMDVQVTSG